MGFNLNHNVKIWIYVRLQIKFTRYCFFNYIKLNFSVPEYLVRKWGDIVIAMNF